MDNDAIKNANDNSDSHDIINPLKDKDLLFHIDRITGHQRLCIPSPVIKDILKLVYDDGYPGFERYFENILRS